MREMAFLWSAPAQLQRLCGVLELLYKSGLNPQQALCTVVPHKVFKVSFLLFFLPTPGDRPGVGHSGGEGFWGGVTAQAALTKGSKNLLDQDPFLCGSGLRPGNLHLSGEWIHVPCPTGLG